MIEDQGPDGAAAEASARHRVSIGRRVAIGCFTAWLGFVSGAMVAALLSKLAAFMSRAPECAEVPACNWYIWAAAGGAIGAVTLPAMALWVLGKPAKGDKTDRGF